MGSTTSTVAISMYPFKDGFRPDIDAFDERVAGSDEYLDR